MSLILGIAILLFVLYGICHMFGARARQLYWRGIKALLRLPFLVLRGLANAILRLIH